MEEAIILLLIIILIKLFMPNENIAEIKAALVAADEKITKVAADVTRLHEIIDGSGPQPTPEEWAEVKALAGTLNERLQSVDDLTEE